jgi:hypothetical protein
LNRRALEIIAVLTTLAAVAVIWLALHELPPRFDRRPHEALGWGIARQALSLLKPGAGLILITRDAQAYPQPAVDVQLASFTKAARDAHATIVAIKRLQLDPLRPAEVPPGDFFELIRRAPAGCVIVSLMGPPNLTAEQFEQLKDVKPKIVAFFPGTPPSSSDLDRWFKSRLLHVAIANRNMSLTSIPQANTREGWFNHWFQTYSATNMPQQSGLDVAPGFARFP